MQFAAFQQIYPEERRTCYVCSDENECESNPSNSRVCTLYNPNEMCVTKINNDGITERGCSSDLTCSIEDATNCQICADNNCNDANLKRKTDGNPGIWQNLPLSCYNCNNAADCAASTLTETTCTDQEYCMTVFDNAGVVIRKGCSNAVEEEQASYCDANSQNCHNCNSNRCNTATSKENYVNCIFCDSERNENCVSQPERISNRRQCNGLCMTALYLRANSSSSYVLTRSCLDDKDVEQQTICTAGGDDKCVSCQGTLCNTQHLPAQRLSCIQCEGDGCEDPASVTCPFYRDDDKCYTLFKQDGNIEKMGCYSDLSDREIADKAHLMLTCDDKDNCNNFDFPSSYICASCDSANDPICASYPEEIPTVETCSTLPNTQCYSRVWSGK